MSRPRMENWGPTHQEEEDQFQKEKMHYLLEKDLHYQEHSAEPELLSEGNAGDRLANLYYHLINKARGARLHRRKAGDTRSGDQGPPGLPEPQGPAGHHHRGGAGTPTGPTPEHHAGVHQGNNPLHGQRRRHRLNVQPVQSHSRREPRRGSTSSPTPSPKPSTRAWNRDTQTAGAGPEERNEQQEKTDFQKQTEEYQEMLADNPEHNYLVAETPGERLASLLYHVCATAEERGFLPGLPRPPSQPAEAHAGPAELRLTSPR